MSRTTSTGGQTTDWADRTSVFINAPFDIRYEPLFVTLVGSLVFLGQSPRCVLEVREAGQGRLERILDLIAQCGLSIHDLSRVGTPARLNMPFELGAACAFRRATGNHVVIVMDAKPYRLDRILSDYKGHDPIIHHGRCVDLCLGVLDIFNEKDVSPDALIEASVQLRRVSSQLKRNFKSPTVFRPAIFLALVAAATELAKSRGFIVS